MRIGNDAHRADIHASFNWISGLLGAELDKRVRMFEQHERRNPLLATHFRQHFALEFALADARQYRKNTHRLPKKGYDELYGFLIPAHRIHQKLPQSVRTPFEGRLRAALTGAHGIRPFAYEIGIATDLMQRGWDIEFVDYTGLGQFDILARRESVEVEVECKTTSGDTGRKIHRQEVNRLADLILPTTQTLADVPGCHLVQVTVPSRLGKSNEELSSIASTVAAAAHSKDTASDRYCKVEYRMGNATTWPDARQEPEAHLFFEQQLGLTNAHLLVHGRGDASVVAVAITSEQADSVVKTISEQAKDAADQCTGTRPAVIALHMVDPLDTPQLEDLLRTSNGLHAIAGAVFNSEKRMHIDSLAFTVPQKTLSAGRSSRWLSGEGVILHNPEPRFPCDGARAMFSRSEG